MNLHNIYKERGEEFSKLVCSNESCSIDCLENINFNKTTTLAIIDGVIEGIKESKQSQELERKNMFKQSHLTKMQQIKSRVSVKSFNSALEKQINLLQAQRALITKE